MSSTKADDKVSVPQKPPRSAPPVPPGQTTTKGPKGK